MSERYTVEPNTLASIRPAKQFPFVLKDAGQIIGFACSEKQAKQWKLELDTNGVIEVDA